MDEEVLIHNVKVLHRFEKLPMLVRNASERTRIAIRVQGSVLTGLEKSPKCVIVFSRLKQHFVMVAKNRDQMAATGQLDKRLDDATRVDAAIDVVANRHNGITVLYGKSFK